MGCTSEGSGPRPSRDVSAASDHPPCRCYQLNDHAQLYRSLLDPPPSPPSLQLTDVDTDTDAAAAAIVDPDDPEGLKAAARRALAATAAAAPEVAKGLKRREHGIGGGALSPATLAPSSLQQQSKDPDAVPPNDGRLTLGMPHTLGLKHNPSCLTGRFA